MQESNTPSSLHSLLAEANRNRADSKALSGPGGQLFSYGELLLCIERSGAFLRRIGIHRNDKVALISPSRAEDAAALLAIASTCACAPMPAGLASAALQERLRRVAPRLVVITRDDDGTAVEAAEALAVPILRMADSPGLSDALFAEESITPSSISDTQTLIGHRFEWGSGDDIALILPTSGTTGDPRLVPLSHNNLYAAASSICDVLQLSAEDRCLDPMPLAHIHGLSLILASLVSGAHVHVTGPFSHESFRAGWQQLKPTWYSAAPAMHALIADWLERQPDLLQCSCLRLLRSASGPMQRGLLERLENLMGVPLIEAYGMTEAAPQIASNRLPPQQRKAGSVGRAAGPKITILDSDGHVLPAGEIGEVAISGPNVMSGYLDAPTDMVFAQNHSWLRTGDRGHLDADGDLFLSGRLAEQIERGGLTIAPEPIEALLLSHPLVRDAAVFPVQHAVLGQIVAAAVAVSDIPTGRQPALLKELRSLLITHLTAGHVPQPILIVRELPMQAGGKRRRRELARHLGLSLADQGSASPLSETERSLALLWGEVLHDLPSSNRDNFFLIGGHSLAASRLLARLEARLNLHLPMAWVFEHPTLAEQSSDLGQRLASRLLATHGNLQEGQGGEIGSTRSQGDPDQAGEWAPLSPAQQGIWLLERMGQGRAYVMAMGWEINGALDLESLRQSLQLLIERHESLRCVFQLVEERPMQRALVARHLSLPLIDGQAWAAGMADRELQLHAQRLRQAPFNLETGPILRAELIRLETQRHLLLVTVHHLVFDRWSAGRFQLELFQAYAALAAGRQPALPPVPISILDAARDLSDRLTAAAESQLAEFWRQRLAGAPRLCTFPASRPRPDQLSGDGAMVRRSLSGETWSQIQRLAREQGLTPFMVIVATMKALLGRYSDLQDVVVGTPHAERSKPEYESLIGCFATSVPLRTDLGGDPNVLTLLQRVKDSVCTAFDHADLTLDRLVELLELPRSTGHAPVFQVMIAFQNLPDDGQERLWVGEACRVTPITIDDHSSKFDLSLYLEFADGDVACRWQYSTDIYEDADVQRLAAHFELLLERTLADPNQSLSQLTQLPESERLRLAQLGSGQQRPEFLSNDVVKLIESHAQDTPEASALIGLAGCLDPSWPDQEPAATDGMLELSYATLNQCANRLAHALRQRGLSQGHRVGLLLPRTCDAIISQLALLKLGVCFVGLDPSHPRDRIQWMVEDLALRAVITTAEVATLAEGNTLILDELASCLLQQTTANPDQIPQPDAAAYILYTSGSTGAPKGVVVSRANLSNYGPALAAELGIYASDRWLHIASFSFSSSIRQSLVPLMAGATVVVAPTSQRADPVTLWHWIRDQQISIVDLVPTHWRLCHAALAALDEKAHQALLNDLSLRLMLSASEPMPMTLPEQWTSLLERGVKLYNMYGQTETTGIVTVQRIERSVLARRGLMPIGRPIANLRCLVLDADAQPVPMNTEGELWIGGAGVGIAYWKQPEMSASRFIEDPHIPGERLFRTGDRAVLLADGCMHLLGRRDDQLKVAGVRIEPAEIEAVLLEEAGISRAAVVAAIAPPQRLMAYVESSEPETTVRDALMRRLDRRLPVVMHPSELVILQQLPQTSNGKVDRKVLAHQVDSDVAIVARPISRRRYIAPRTEKQQKLATIWADVLGLSRVGLDDNFFEIGGDSLRSVRVVERAQAAGLVLDLTMHFRYQTIGSLAEACWSEPSGTQRLPQPLPRSRPIQPAKIASSPEGVIVAIEPLRAFGERLLREVGLDEDGARIVTDVQLESSLRGQPTHNIDSLPRYARRLRAGTLNGKPSFRIEDDGGFTIRLDGDNAPGQWVASVAMERAIERARQRGLCLVTACRSNHYGAAGHYAWQAARHGQIGFTTTNGPVILAPTGGTTACFGNNPIGVGIPALRYPPVLVDFAMTVAPRGRIALTVAEGNPLPPGWILDRQGRPTTDLEDLAAGLGIPIGEHKGYGLALVLEILAGVLSGAGFGLDHGRHLLGAYSGGADFGHFFLAIDPALMQPISTFLERVDRMISQAKASELADGVTEILIPGERELRTRELNLSKGTVFLSAHSWRQLQRYAEEAEVPGLPKPLDGGSTTEA